MIANIKILKSYCSEYTQIENYAEAVKSPLKYDLHHRLEISEMQSASDLIFLHLYYHRPPEELIFLSHGEHVRLHKANLSAETRQKLSAAKKGKHPSTETRQKMSEAKKGNQNTLGRHCSEETRQKMSDAKKGHHCSEETRKKISEARKGDKNPSFGKPGTCLGRHWHLENGKRIYTD